MESQRYLSHLGQTKFLKQSGILDAYESLTKQMISHGWPQDQSIFEFTADELLRWAALNKNSYACLVDKDLELLRKMEREYYSRQLKGGEKGGQEEGKGEAGAGERMPKRIELTSRKRHAGETKIDMSIFDKEKLAKLGEQKKVQLPVQRVELQQSRPEKKVYIVSEKERREYYERAVGSSKPISNYDQSTHDIEQSHPQQQTKRTQKSETGKSIGGKSMGVVEEEEGARKSQRIEYLKEQLERTAKLADLESANQQYTEDFEEEKISIQEIVQRGYAVGKKSQKSQGPISVHDEGSAVPLNQDLPPTPPPNQPPQARGLFQVPVQSPGANNADEDDNGEIEDTYGDSQTLPTAPSMPIDLGRHCFELQVTQKDGGQWQQKGKLRFEVLQGGVVRGHSVENEGVKVEGQVEGTRVNLKLTFALNKNKQVDLGGWIESKDKIQGRYQLVELQQEAVEKGGTLILTIEKAKCFLDDGKIFLQCKFLIDGQVFSTDNDLIGRNSPHWDKSFEFAEVFDMEKELYFEILNNEEPLDEKFVGECTVKMRELCEEYGGELQLQVVEKGEGATFNRGTLYLKSKYIPVHDPAEVDQSGGWDQSGNFSLTRLSL